MGKKLIIANWKMNLSVGEASLFVRKLDKLVENDPNVEVVIAPTTLGLQPLKMQVQGHPINLAAQNFYWRDSGAYTGEVSAAQLHGIAKYALIGHSERRHVFGERGLMIRNKVQAAYRNGIIPVLCIGETARERTDKEANDVLRDQLNNGLVNITGQEADELVVAYEPVWAIGSGEVPTPRDIEQASGLIRRQIKHLFGEASSKRVRILYGGSVNTDNAASILSLTGIDGLLIGGASLDAYAFAAIVKQAQGREE